MKSLALIARWSDLSATQTQSAYKTIRKNEVYQHRE